MLQGGDTLPVLRRAATGLAADDDARCGARSAPLRHLPARHYGRRFQRSGEPQSNIRDAFSEIGLVQPNSASPAQLATLAFAFQEWRFHGTTGFMKGVGPSHCGPTLRGMGVIAQVERFPEKFPESLAVWTPVIADYRPLQTHEVEVQSGLEGFAMFQSNVRSLFGINSELQMDLSFDCSEPSTGHQNLLVSKPASCSGVLLAPRTMSPTNMQRCTRAMRALISCWVAHASLET